MQNDDISVNLFVRLDSTRYTTFLLPSSIHRLPLPPSSSSQVSHPTTSPDRCAAKFNVRQVSGSRETCRSIFRIGISTRRFTIRIHPFFFFFLANPCRAYIYMHTYVRVTRTRSLSLSIFRGGRNEIGAIARFHLQSGTKLSMLNLIS